MKTFLSLLSLAVALGFAALPPTGLAATGSLTVTVRNQDGTAIVGATVVRYTSTWSFIDQKDTGSGGVASWANIATGSYNLEAYYNGEYWVNGSANVTAGQTARVTLQRNEPYAFDFRV